MGFFGFGIGAWLLSGPSWFLLVGVIAAGPAGVWSHIGVVLVVVIFLCVCGLDGCFSDNQGLYWPVWISKTSSQSP